MNIQNLNTEELEQLQTLLNKMNPPQPIKKIYSDPVNEIELIKIKLQIEELINKLK